MLIKSYIVLALLVLGFGLAGKADKEEAERQADQYCEFVADGTWPAYDPDINCNQKGE